MRDRYLPDQSLYQYRARSVRVIDGDTLILEFSLVMTFTCQFRCRLVGLDGPELHKRQGKRRDAKRGGLALLKLRELVQDRELLVRTKRDRLDKWGRLLVEIFRRRSDGGEGWESVNELMIESGNAWHINKDLKRTV